ncbi:hypothetical protein [Mesorhizobium sp. M1143]|uniref:hypothetical protein n=1 Tax=Mesorhizobium sp. M1143 TaxID=2957061 RepID=UPI0033362FA3
MMIKEDRERLDVALRIGREISPPSHAQADMKHRLRRPDRCTIKKRQLFFIDKVPFGPRLSKWSFRNLHRAI